MRNRIVGILLFFSFLYPFISHSSVVDSSSMGFTVRSEQSVKVAPSKLYEVFVKELPRWWDPAHTWSGKAENLSVNPEPGGCFCEKLENGGEIRHMGIVYADPGKLFRMEGGLGPLQQYAVTGILTLEIRRDGEKSVVTLTYTVGGYIPGGAAKFATPVDNVLSAQFRRYLAFAGESL